MFILFFISYHIFYHIFNYFFVILISYSILSFFSFSQWTGPFKSMLYDKIKKVVKIKRKNERVNGEKVPEKKRGHPRFFLLLLHVLIFWLENIK